MVQYQSSLSYEYKSQKYLSLGILASRRRDPEPQRVQDPGRPLQAGGSLAQSKVRDHVRGGHEDHLHLPNDVQLVPAGRAGLQVPGEEVESGQILSIYPIDAILVTLQKFDRLFLIV